MPPESQKNLQSEFRKLPSVHNILAQPELAALTQQHSPKVMTTAARQTLAAARSAIRNGDPAPPLPRLTTMLKQQLQALQQPKLRPLINATGVIIHTNLGRAVLSAAAQQAMQQVAANYSNLEYDLAAGQRGSRYEHAADLLCQLTGAEAAVVVNNNAAAVILTLTVLAQQREVIISRGQLVEIGGGFRIPDIMAQSGARLVEVGSTNRTYCHDFEQAITPNTGLLLTVHHSNYQITGFTTQPSLAELAALGQKHGIPLMEDLGSGTLLDTTPFGLAHEPTIQESIAAGVDVVTASGDKLLGGPQAGIILGRKALIARLRRFPLIRALRVDKTTLAALEATLRAYLEERATTMLPVWRMIAASAEELQQRASMWQQNLADCAASITVQPSQSTVGGGSLPGQTLPTHCLAISGPALDALAQRLRRNDPPIISRVENDQLLLDPRTVLPEQEQSLLLGLRQALMPTKQSEEGA